MARFKTLLPVPAVAAALSLAASPAVAIDVPAATPHAAPPAFPAFAADSENVERHRRNRYRHNRGIDMGDVLAGALIIGGIAAIASAASKPRRNKRSERQRVSRYQTGRQMDRRSNSGQGIVRAVNTCLEEIEYYIRVDSVDGIDRTASGWTVTGRLYNGESFTCQTGTDGSVGDVSYGGKTSAYNGVQARDRQYSSARYGQIRRQAERQVAMNDRQSTYPGGPVNGQYYPEGSFGK